MGILALLAANPFAAILLVVSVVMAITIHEFAHAWVADHLGDPTPRLEDRVTLNPLAHLDPLGSLVFLMTLRFGWGKPVIIDPYNFRNRRWDMMLVAIAGPLSNLLLALLLVLIPPNPFSPIIWYMVQMNVSLAIFNLIPVHPLDGGKILSAFLPPMLAHEYDEALYAYGGFILLLLILPLVGGQSAVSALLEPVLRLVLGFFALLGQLFYG